MSSPSSSTGGQARVVFVNRYYAPDVSATSQMLTDLAEALARDGLQITVVCSRQLYEDPHAVLAPRETTRGVSILRVYTTRFGRARLLGRALDYASFYVTATVLLLRVVRRADALVVKTDPPMLSLIGALVSFFKGARLVNWLQDLSRSGFTVVAVAAAEVDRGSSVRSSRLVASNRTGERGARHQHARLPRFTRHRASVHSDLGELGGRACSLSDVCCTQ